MPNAARIDTLRRAAHAVGGVHGLARRLGFSPRQIERWMNGEEVIPADAFLRAVDLLDDSEPRAAEQPPAPNDTQDGKR